MTEAKTRAEHEEAMRYRLRAEGHYEAVIPSTARDAIDYAIAHGMPVAPELVEPVVGEKLTEQTRLVDMMVVVLGGLAWQLWIGDVSEWRNAADGSTLPADERAMHGATIVYVSESSPTEPVKPSEELGGPSTHDYRESSGCPSVYGCAVCGFPRADHEREANGDD